MLAVFFVRLTVSAKASELTLQKTSFLDSRLSVSGIRSFMFNVNVPMKMLECLVQNTAAGGGILRASGCGVLIEGTTFRGLLGGSAIVTEGEGTCPDPYYNLDVTGPINCTLSAIHVRTVNASFEDLHATDPGERREFDSPLDEFHKLYKQLRMGRCCVRRHHQH